MPFQVQRDPDTGEITSVTYHGDRNEIFRDIDRGVRISINTIGDEVFSLDRLKVIDEATGTLKHTRHNLVMGSTLVDDPDRPLGDIYSGTYPGVFRINGVEIFYDADDTLNDIKDKINESGCNIYASYVFSEGSYKLSLRTNEAEEFWLEDLGDGELLQDLGLISPPPDEPPRNIDTSATEEKITLFQALIDLRDDLRADRTDRVRGRDLGNIDKCLENLLVHRSKIGAKMNRLERMREKHVDMNVFAKEILNEAESADMEDVIMNLAIQQTIQRAALASGARLIRPTLMDFLG
jgi:flagellar hook-associated protein 3 FlgL